MMSCLTGSLPTKNIYIILYLTWSYLSPALSLLHREKQSQLIKNILEYWLNRLALFYLVCWSGKENLKLVFSFNCSPHVRNSTGLSGMRCFIPCSTVPVATEVVSSPVGLGEGSASNADVVSAVPQQLFLERREQRFRRNYSVLL